MQLELHLDGRTAILNEISREGNRIKIAVDDEIFEVDLVKVGPAEYSVIYKGLSYNIEVVPGREPKHFTVNTFYFSNEVEVVDAETRYMRSRLEEGSHHAGNIIRSPMPGKVVKIMVNKGDQVDAGQTVIIVSAMKMESEFKAGKAGTVSEIAVKEGDTVDGDQVLVVIDEEQKS